MAKPAVRIISTLVLSAALAACASSGQPASDTQSPASSELAAPEAISAVRAAYLAAWNGGNPEAFNMLFHRYAIVQVPGERYTGYDDILQRWIGPTMRGISDFRVTPIEFMKLGDDVVETGRLTYRTTHDSGKVETKSAKFTQRWQLGKDGTWRIAAMDLN